MVFTQAELISELRLAVNIDNKGVEDSEYLAMSGEEILLFIKIAISKVFPTVDDLSDLPNGSAYPITLLAKKELYLKLAVSSANFIDMTADNNNQLRRSQRFDHYMKLAENAQSEYDSWSESDTIDPETGLSGVITYDVLLDKRHYSNRNYTKSLSPVVHIKINEVLSDSVEFSWKSVLNRHFGKYLVYVSTSPVYDPYLSGYSPESKVVEGSTLIKSTNNPLDCFVRLEGLKPETTYYLAVFSIERNQRFGVKEVSFTTLSEVEDSENISVPSLGGD